MSKAAWGPKDAADSEEWSGFSLNVPSLNFVLGNKDVYDYKLPYSVPSAPRCARIHPYLFCCDAYFCRCLSAKGELTFMDVVDQSTGHQVRYRTQKKCCMVPRILTFMDGQYIGHVSRTMRCGNRCLTCLEDYQSKPVLQLGLHDKSGSQIARIDRNGKGSCCYCNPKFPMKCTGCMFTCVTCTCLMKPTPSPCFTGCLDCDPVCCECCVKGDKAICSMFDCICCCIGCPLACPPCWCCTPGCEVQHFDNVSTIKFNDFEVIDSKSKEQVGLLQAQFRGNYPSMYFHDAETAFKINGNTESGLQGVLLSAVATGMSYALGGAEPTFSGLKSTPQGTSPDFSGWVECTWRPQMEMFVGLNDGEAKLREDLIVNDDMVFGTASNGTQVKGWRLMDFGYKNQKGCMGKERKPRSVNTLQEVKDMVQTALENQIGDMGTTFFMRFRLPDMEKGVIKKSGNIFGEVEELSSKFNPPGGGFIDQMEEVDCTINCVRLCKGCDCSNRDKVVCCRCPVYARVVNTSKGNPAAWAEPPPTVIMVNAPAKPWSAAGM